MIQLDLFPVSHEDVKEALAELRTDHARIHRALFSRIHELEKENLTLTAQVEDLHSALFEMEGSERYEICAAN